MLTRPTTDDSMIYDSAETTGEREAARSLKPNYRLLLGAILATGVAGAADGDETDAAWVADDSPGEFSIPFLEICEYFNLDAMAVRQAINDGGIVPGDLRNFSISYMGDARILPYQRGMQQSRVRSSSPFCYTLGRIKKGATPFGSRPFPGKGTWRKGMTNPTGFTVCLAGRSCSPLAPAYLSPITQPAAYPYRLAGPVR